MDETGDHHVKQNKPSSERQILHIFSHMQNLDLKRSIYIYIYIYIWDYLGETAGGGKGKREVRGREYDQSALYAHMEKS
jgi:hypothetical protein